MDNIFYYPNLDQIDAENFKIKSIVFENKLPITQTLFNQYTLSHFQNQLTLFRSLYTNGIFFPRSEYETPFLIRSNEFKYINEQGKWQSYYYKYLQIKPFFILCDNIFTTVFDNKILRYRLTEPSINNIIEQQQQQFDQDYFQLILVKTKIGIKDKIVFSIDQEIKFIRVTEINDQIFDQLKNSSFSQIYETLFGQQGIISFSEQNYPYILRDDYILQQGDGTLFQQKQLETIDGYCYILPMQLQKIKIEKILTKDGFINIQNFDPENLLVIYPQINQKYRKQIQLID